MTLHERVAALQDNPAAETHMRAVLAAIERAERKLANAAA